MVWLIHADLTPPFQKSALELIGQLGPEATLFAPTFTFSTCRGASFDPKRSRGETGLFGNYLLSLEGAHRSAHPIFSFAGIGPRSKELLRGVSPFAFGPDSLFDRLAKEKTRLLFAGAPFGRCTFVHYVEQRAGVSYRSSKWFGDWEYFVRPLDGSVVTTTDRLEQRLLDRGLLQADENGWLEIELADLLSTAKEALAEDPYFLLERAPHPIVEP